MNGRQTNAEIDKGSRGKSIPNNKKAVKVSQNQNQIQQKKSILDKKRKIKVDYNSDNYFYHDDEYYGDYPYSKINYYDKSKKEHRYKNDTNDSYVTVEQEDGQIKYMTKNYIEYKRSSPPYMYKDDKNIQNYEDEDSENNYNNTDNIYYENEDDFEQQVEHPSQRNNYQYQNINNYYLTQNNSNSASNNNRRKRKSNNNQNIISKAVNHQVNYIKDIKRKNRQVGGSVHELEKNTTTNNTYNNNIYYINSINMKNKSTNKREENNNRIRKNRISINNNSNKNSVYKNVDLTIPKRKLNKERDYFKMNNITDKETKEKCINSAILIQSYVRAYLVKMKLFNNLQLYLNLKNGVFILNNFFLLKNKIKFLNLFKNYAQKLYDDFLGSKAINVIKEYLKTNNSKSKEKKNINSFHKELGDSFNIIIDNSKKENSEKKLKSKLNDVIKENKELKIQLGDNKNFEEKMKNLIDENKKNKNINDIIMKDNQQLAKKLKDMQDYRNTNLFIDNKVSIDLTQEEKLQIEELIKNNSIYLDRLKKVLLINIIHRRINTNKYILKDKFNKYRNIIEKIKNKEKENNYTKELFIRILFSKIENFMKSKKQKFFWNLYYNNVIKIKESIFNNKLLNKCLKNMIKNKQLKNKNVLHKAFFRYYSNTIKCKEEENKENEKDEEIKNKEQSKKLLLKKIFKNYHNNKILMYRIYMDKWNLKSIILGIRAAARDKKKKRKLKKKNNRQIYQKHFGLNNNTNSNNLGTNYYKSNHEFSYIVSNGAVIKESSSNEPVNNFRNNKTSTSSDKVNKINNLGNKNSGMMKKTNSVNEISIQNNINNDNKEDNKENLNGNEESEEDSGDSFGLDG